MGGLKNILLYCQEKEREYERMGIHDDGRMINKGWIECCEFFFRNFDLKEKAIEESPVGIGFAQKDNKQKEQ